MMSVSANYRVAYDRAMIAVINRLDDMNQWLSTTLTVTPFVRFSDPNLHQEVGGKPPILPLPNPGKPFAALPFERYGRGHAFKEGTKTPYTQNWSLHYGHFYAAGIEQAWGDERGTGGIGVGDQDWRGWDRTSRTIKPDL